MSSIDVHGVNSMHVGVSRKCFSIAKSLNAPSELVWMQ